MRRVRADTGFVIYVLRGDYDICDRTNTCYRIIDICLVRAYAACAYTRPDTTVLMGQQYTYDMMSN